MKHKMASPRFQLAVLLAVAPALWPAVLSASLSIRPAYLEIDLGEGRPSEVFQVTNITGQEVRYRAQVVHFRFAEKGGFEITEPDQQSLAGWLKFNPREFTLAPGETRAIRVTVLPPGNLAGGEYWGALWLEPLQGAVTSSEDGKGRKASIEVKANILVSIFGTLGHLDYRCTLDDLEAHASGDGIDITTNLSNTGTGRCRVSGSYEVIDGGGAVVADGLIGEDLIMPAGRRRFQRHVSGSFVPGEFSVRVRYSSQNWTEELAGQTRVR